MLFNVACMSLLGPIFYAQNLCLKDFSFKDKNSMEQHIKSGLVLIRHSELPLKYLGALIAMIEIQNCEPELRILCLESACICNKSSNGSAWLTAGKHRLGELSVGGLVLF